MITYFENQIVKLHVLYVFKTHIKFHVNHLVGSQIVAHTLIETGNGPNRPNTIDL